MAKRTVTTPAGEPWQVRRLWAPRLQGESLWARLRRRMRVVRRRSEAMDVPDPGCAVDALDELIFVVVLVAVVLFVVLVGFPLLVALLDVLLVALLTVLGVVGRVVFRRPWVVEATGPDELRRTWRVVGWRASREAVDFVADALAHGHPPPPGHEVARRVGAPAAAPADVHVDAPVDAPRDAPVDGAT